MDIKRNALIDGQGGNGNGKHIHPDNSNSEVKELSPEINYDEITTVINNTSLNTYKQALEVLRTLEGAVQKRFVRQLANILKLDDYDIQSDIEGKAKATQRSTPNLTEIVRDCGYVIQKGEEQSTYIINPHLPEKSLVLVPGRYGSKKSIIFLKMALDIATGQPWLNLPTVQSEVLYIDMENTPNTLKKRLYGFGYTEKNYPTNFKWLLRNDVLSLDVERDISALKEVCRGRVIIIDTLSKVHTREENSNAQMQPVMEMLLNLARIEATAVIILHHMGKQEDLGSRGAIAIPSACDIEYKISVPTGNKDIVNFRCTKHRDANEDDLSKTLKVTFTDDCIAIEDASDEVLNAFLKAINMLPKEQFSTQGSLIKGVQELYDTGKINRHFSHEKAKELLEKAVAKRYLNTKKGANNSTSYALAIMIDNAD